MLGKQHARPEQVDEAVLAVGFFDMFFKCGDAATADAKDLEKVVQAPLNSAVKSGQTASAGSGSIVEQEIKE